MATKTYLQTKRYTKEENDYFWIKNIDFKETMLGFSVGNMTSNPEYSYDKVTWYDKTDGGGWWRIYLKPGQKVYLRNDAGFFNTNNNRINNFQFDVLRLAVGGPISSLIDYTDMSNVTSIPNYCFYRLFSGDSYIDNITSGERWYDASQIDFGNITSVGDYGMAYMFYSCTNLKHAPADLRVITTVSNNYGMDNLFSYCGNLGEVTAPNVSVWDTSAMGNWLYATGDFISEKIINCPTGLVIPTDTYSGIPDNTWTRVDY